MSSYIYSSRKSTTIVGFKLAALLFLSACQTSGSDGVLSNVLPRGTDGSNQEVASVAPPSGQNPNAVTRFKNTRNPLSDYCPAVRIRSGTEAFRVYQGKDRDDDNKVKYQASIIKVARECTYVGQDLQIKVGARGRIITGPAGSPGSFKMPIRVAVQEGNCSRHFKLHQFTGNIAAGTSNSAFEFVDDTIVIPAPKSTNVRIFLGFDETPNAKSSAKSCAS